MQLQHKYFCKRLQVSTLNQGIRKMKAIQKFLVTMMEAWIEGRNQYLAYKDKKQK